jgi:hypothetical protein
MICKVYLTEKGKFTFAELRKRYDGMYVGKYINIVPNNKEIKRYLDEENVECTNKAIVYNREINSTHTLGFDDLVLNSDGETYSNNGVSNSFSPTLTKLG